MARRRRRLGVCTMVGALFFTVLPTAAGQYATSSGFSATDYATGFPESAVNHWGPLGIAFDQSDNLYVADTVDGNIYRFQPGGGVAGAATRLSSSPIPGTIAGLVVAPSGAIYLARYSPGDVVEIDPGTGQIVRTVADVPCATGLAIDPVSGDLFVSENQCGSTIYRISGYQHRPGTVSSYTEAPGVDGLAFDRDGTLYAESDGTVIRIDGTNSSTPGAVTDLAQVPDGDGLAFGSHTLGTTPELVANRNDGIVTVVDFSRGFPAETNIFTGGSRGDFAAVDSQGCLYITQSSSIVRIGGPGQTCTFQPSAQGAAAPPGVVVSVLGRTATRACVKLKSIALRLRQQGRVRLRSATIYVNGRRVKRVSGSAVMAPVTLTRLPQSSFTVKVVALTTRGKRLISTHFYANCVPPKRTQCTRRGRVLLSVPRKRVERIVSVTVYLNGRRIDTVHGRNVNTVALAHHPSGRFRVKLLTRDSRGRSAVLTRTFVGCG